ncbi:hypothetical protein [Spirosoma sp. KUDC1026]|uniref:hypothetical protein n=1 Tax=Spirosoma sp. KUDC1026 TaxID=2745947 RepID=UPI00159BE471|nr:hypothetical protein [Spirosoma sp. KUDC1026]QKZ12190.1 hypothetical protein HU175_05935 [Spirosoma sp. KUDC1026]
MRVTLEVKDSEWEFLSSLLKRFEFVHIQRAEEAEKADYTHNAPTFKATRLDTNGFTFNRGEANER